MKYFEKNSSMKEEILAELIGAGVMLGAGVGTIAYVKHRKKKIKKLKKGKK